jgi:hypothetical protein
MPKAEHKKISRPKQEGYEIALDAESNNVNKVWIRFGKLDAKGNHKWDQTVALEQVSLTKTQKRTLLKVSDDQLPASADATYYQLLCEIDGDHGHPEVLMTEPTLLM